MEEVVAGSSCLWRDFASSAAWLHQLLCSIHILGGDFAWGDRYVSTAVELAALLAVPSVAALSAVAERLDMACRNNLIAISFDRSNRVT